MPDRARATEGSDQQEAADDGYFAPIALARYMRLTTFKRDGVPVSASVHGAADGDRTYFRARNKSETVRRLRHTDAVQVMPCGALGFCTYGPPLDAIARRLSGEEASRVAAKLDRRHTVQRLFLIRRLRRQAVYYELLADGAAGGRGGLPEGPSASLITRVHMSQGFVRADAAAPSSLATVCTPSAVSSRSSPCPPNRTRIITVSMSLASGTGCRGR